MKEKIPKAEIIITRHNSLVTVLKELSIAQDDVKVVHHATPDIVRGKVVAGVLPLSLASEAKYVITIDLNLSPNDRGRELSASELKERLTGVSVYKVEKVTQIL